MVRPPLDLYHASVISCLVSVAQVKRLVANSRRGSIYFKGGFVPQYCHVLYLGICCRWGEGPAFRKKAGSRRFCSRGGMMRPDFFGIAVPPWDIFHFIMGRVGPRNSWVNSSLFRAAGSLHPISLNVTCFSFFTSCTEVEGLPFFGIWDDLSSL